MSRKKKLNKNAKLTIEQANEIRQLYYFKSYTKAKLSRLFGIHSHQISLILTNLEYKMDKFHETYIEKEII